MEATQAIEEALGIVTQIRTFKPEAQTNCCSTANSLQARQRQ